MAKIKTKGYSLKKDHVKYLLLYILTIICILLLIIDTIINKDNVTKLIIGIKIIIIIVMTFISYQFFKKYMIINAGVKGEKEVKTLLKTIPNQLIYANIPVHYKNKHSEIDYLCISENGLFIVEVKNYRGDIKGKNEDIKWKQIKQKEVKEVKNPIKQLDNQIQILSSILKDNNINIHIEGCVYFHHASSIECKDKKIINNAQELIKRINNQNNKLTKQQIKQIKRLL